MLYYVASDLHLEYYGDDLSKFESRLKSEIEGNTEVVGAAGTNEPRALFLCGDIGYPWDPIYEKFLKLCSDNFDQVYVVAGNHEYYSVMSQPEINTIDDIDCQIGLIVAKYHNVCYLRDSYHVDHENHVIVYGCTLWSNVKTDKKMINDFKYIYAKKDKKIEIADYQKMHRDCVDKLKGSLEEIGKFRADHSDYELVVMTHHLPTYDLVTPKYRGHPINEFFASDLDWLIEESNRSDEATISYWFCGHTHSHMEADVAGTKCIVYPQGYPGENDVMKLFKVVTP